LPAVGNAVEVLDVDKLLGVGVVRVNAWCKEEYLPPGKRQSLGLRNSFSSRLFSRDHLRMLRTDSPE
jgi:hypothetical protein